MVDLSNHDYILNARYSLPPFRTRPRRPNVVILRAYNKCPKKQVLKKQEQRLFCQRHEEDCDLTLLDNLNWIINFPVANFFQHVFDDGDECQSKLSNKVIDRTKSPNSSLVDDVEAVPDSFVAGGRSWKQQTDVHRPSITYSQMIENCLQLKGPQTVNQIYNWISSSYPFYKADGEGWKNAVRHNLSIKSQFRKGEKSRGRSHVWHLDDGWKTFGFYNSRPFSNTFSYFAGRQMSRETMNFADDNGLSNIVRPKIEDCSNQIYVGYHENRLSVDEISSPDKQEHLRFEMVVEDGQYHCNGQDADWDYSTDDPGRSDLTSHAHMSASSHQWITSLATVEDIIEVKREENCCFSSNLDCSDLMKHLDNADDLNNMSILKFL